MPVADRISLMQDERAKYQGKGPPMKHTRHNGRTPSATGSESAG